MEFGAAVQMVSANVLPVISQNKWQGPIWVAQKETGYESLSL